MSQIKLQCFDCQKEIEIPREFSRREECPECGADIHACKNCVFYDESSYNDCRESSADVFPEKERANHCDYFQISSELKSQSSKEDLLSAAEALFKK